MVALFFATANLNAKSLSMPVDKIVEDPIVMTC